MRNFCNFFVQFWQFLKENFDYYSLYQEKLGTRVKNRTCRDNHMCDRCDEFCTRSFELCVQISHLFVQASTLDQINRQSPQVYFPA